MENYHRVKLILKKLLRKRLAGLRQRRDWKWNKGFIIKSICLTHFDKFSLTGLCNYRFMETLPGKKRLGIYGWCIMTSHLRMIIGSKKDKLEDIICDMKKHTSSELKTVIKNGWPLLLLFIPENCWWI
jgi:hypothetical protein